MGISSIKSKIKKMYSKIASSLNLISSKKPMTVFVVSRAEKNKSAISRNNLSEKKRLINRARKSSISAHKKRVVSALSALSAQHVSKEEEFKPVEELIARLFTEIDKAVLKGVIHPNNGDRRKSQVARMKKKALIEKGLYSPHL